MTSHAGRSRIYPTPDLLVPEGVRGERHGPAASPAVGRSGRRPLQEGAEHGRPR